MSLIRRGGRVVEGTGLENRQGVKALEGSNPSLSASMTVEHVMLGFYTGKGKEIRTGIPT